jgi:CheY-like chemotaxis protein
MARVPSVAKTEQTARSLTTAAGNVAVTGRSCGNCGSIEIRPSNRRNAMDILLACVFLVPFRCRTCRKRFYRVWRPVLQQSPDPPAAPVLVMPARRKVRKADAVSARRIALDPVLGPAKTPTAMKADVIASAPVASPGADPEPLPPLLDTAPGPAAQGATAPRAIALGAILILESDLSIRKLLRRLLERRGYLIVELDQADNLASQLRNRRADLLIVDASPTGEPSVNALAALARAHPGLKILALSAEPFECPEQGGEFPGRVSVLAKPFPLDSFVDCVDRILVRSSPPNISL